MAPRVSPTRAHTGCTHPGCPNPGTGGRCPDHPHPRRWDGGAHGRAMPPGWAATRARILARDPVCRLCGAAPSAEVHHTEPGIEADEALLGVCPPCHRAITATQAAAARHPATG